MTQNSWRHEEPKVKQAIVNFRLTPQQASLVRQAAKRDRRALSDFVRLAVFDKVSSMGIAIEAER